MANEQDNTERVLHLTSDEESSLRRVFESAGYEVFFIEEYMRVVKQGKEDLIPYTKIREFDNVVRVRRQ